jgi:RelA/SpoT family protein
LGNKLLDSQNCFNDDFENEENESIYMALREWAIPKFSKGQVDKAGTVFFLTPPVDKIMEAVGIIDNWRSAHNYPLNIFQDGLRKRAKPIFKECIIAQRIKRLSSIVAKLVRFKTMRLSMMQDIGGCRAVMANVKQVEKLVNNYKSSDIKHKLQQEDDYIKNPKPSGYRSVHLIYRYNGRKTQYNGLKIEIQIRTDIQHAWATAVETVGTFTKQALKSSQGEKDWLRYFALMGAAFAKMEKTNPVPDTPTDDAILKSELAGYFKKLDVENHLHAYGSALQELENYRLDAHYFLLTLDPSTKKLEVVGYSFEDLKKASDDYLAVEKSIEGSSKDAVLVSVDSISALRKAYPNYFLDTNAFITLAKAVIA